MTQSPVNGSKRFWLCVITHGLSLKAFSLQSIYLSTNQRRNRLTMKRFQSVTVAMLLALPLSPAWAADGLNSGDTAWMIVSTALVMMMTPAGLALFYGGMSRYKNLLNTLAMTFVAYCLTSVIWVLWGYSLAFGPDVGGIIGGL